MAISFTGCQRSAKLVPENSPQERRVAECRREALNELHPQSLEIGTLQAVQTLCFVRVGNEDELSEASIRRNAYATQQAETTILMWLVVVITFSGVFLAGIQLFTTYKLVASGKLTGQQESTMTIEAQKVSISSSVTGLVILVVSLAFFEIFVKEVYAIHDTPSAVNSDAPRLIKADMTPAGKPPSGSEDAGSNEHHFTPMKDSVRKEAEKQKQQYGPIP
jgi:hypothetical protein